MYIRPIFQTIITSLRKNQSLLSEQHQANPSHMRPEDNSDSPLQSTPFFISVSALCLIGRVFCTQPNTIQAKRYNELKYFRQPVGHNWRALHQT